MVDARREAIVVESKDEDEAEGVAVKRDSTTAALLAVAPAGEVVERT